MRAIERPSITAVEYRTGPCVVCGTAFTQVRKPGPPRKCCSPECRRERVRMASRTKRAKAGYKAERSEADRARWRADEEYRERMKKYQREWRAGMTPERQLELRLKRHGLTLAAYRNLFDSQGRKCGIPACGATEPGGKSDWHIDHDHSCCPGTKSCGNCIRGILCGTCNRGLGQFKDNPAVLRGAAEYLEAAR